ncbi:hypothetical protein PXK00_12915 [Phaeobacter sp. QD34_3]|uniref:hypothetical protein n=1 Tax=unclassified Phaeobacter TaxID=2621772 RepID=UPI00237FA318|nr:MULTISPECIES: hypothetical protein [unclassified Phaeobacter]MDE4134017.1 hypothetical protein [Phaeobacter sp. QD34_3]MDE4137759.1 hypothetical protein [Phaeobacter sp. QD34_24]
MRRLFQPMRSPFGPFALTAAIAAAQLTPAGGFEYAEPLTRTGFAQVIHFARTSAARPGGAQTMAVTMPEGAAMRVGAP